jgi:hypothetical protein
LTQKDEGSLRSQASGEDLVIEPNEGSQYEEFAVEWAWPRGDRTYSRAYHNRRMAQGLAERSIGETVVPKGSVVQRTVTVSAWEVSS